MNATLPNPPTILVIGYGNDLRSDDAVGQRIADSVATWAIPNVRSLAVHQLTPELAASLESTQRVIFVDACLASEEEAVVKVSPVEPVDSGNFILGHSSDPRSLLALALALYGHYPQAWLVTVPGINFDLGENLSPVAHRGVAEALEKIDDLIGSQS